MNPDTPSQASPTQLNLSPRQKLDFLNELQDSLSDPIDRSTHRSIPISSDSALDPTPATAKELAASNQSKQQALHTTTTDTILQKKINELKLLTTTELKETKASSVTDDKFKKVVVVDQQQQQQHLVLESSKSSVKHARAQFLREQHQLQSRLAAMESMVAHEEESSNVEQVKKAPPTTSSVPCSSNSNAIALTAAKKAEKLKKAMATSDHKKQGRMPSRVRARRQTQLPDAWKDQLRSGCGTSTRSSESSPVPHLKLLKSKRQQQRSPPTVATTTAAVGKDKDHSQQDHVKKKEKKKKKKIGWSTVREALSTKALTTKEKTAERTKRAAKRLALERQEKILAAADAHKKTYVSGKLRKEQGIHYLRSSGKSSPTRSSSTSPRRHRKVSTPSSTGETLSSSPHRFAERGLEEQEKMAAAIKKRRKEKGLSYLRRISIDEVAEARREEEERKQRKEEEETERRIQEENAMLRKKLEAEARKKREEEQEEEWRREEEERKRRKRKVKEAQDEREREERKKRERQEEEWRREEEERKRRKRKVEDQEEREREEREREERERKEREEREREKQEKEKQEREKQERRRVRELEREAAETAAAHAAAVAAVKHVDVAPAQQVHILTPKRVIHSTTSVPPRSSPASFSTTPPSNSHLLHQCYVIASILEDQHVTETIHRADIQGVLTHWRRRVPKFTFLLASVEDDIELSMHRDNGTMYVSEMADILYQRGEGREDLLKHLKVATLEYLRSGGDAGKEREKRDGNGQQNHRERGTTKWTQPTAIRNVRVGTWAAVAEMNGEPCILSYEIDQKILVVRSVDNLGLVHTSDVARISLFIISSISFADTKCHIVVSFAPYSYDLNFGSVQAVMSFVHQLQSCMSDVDVPIDVPIGGGYVDNVEQEESLAENYLNLVAAMHGF